MDGRNIWVTQLSPPVINGITSGAGENAPVIIGDDDNLTISGSGFVKGQTMVRVGAAEIAPFVISGYEIRFSLTDPVLRPGDQEVCAIHKMEMGDSSYAHYGPASNRIKLKIRPGIIGEIMLSNTRVDKVEGISGTAVVQLSCVMGKKQAANLLLNEVSSKNGASYMFKASERSVDADIISFPVTNVKNGNYLARVEVDGAESLLSMAGGIYSDPSIVIQASGGK